MLSTPPRYAFERAICHSRHSRRRENGPYNLGSPTSCGKVRSDYLKSGRPPMVFAFDTLGFSKRLRDRGVPQEQAEAHAEAARDFIMAELVTKTDLQATKTDLQADLLALEGRLEAKIENQSLRVTIRLGIMLAAGIAALAAIMKLAP